MKPALLLVDLQREFLTTGLVEVPSLVVAKAAWLLEQCRLRGVPVAHVWTSLQPHDPQRMEHWKRAARQRCVIGTPAHETPAALQPQNGEPLFHKRGYSPFVGTELASWLAQQAIDTVWIAGVHLHACVRATALDAYQRGLTVRIVRDATASDDPLHAASTRRYLDERDILAVAAAELLDSTPATPVDQAELARAIETTTAQAPLWRRAAVRDAPPRLERLALGIEASGERLAQQMATLLGKPLHYGQGEVRRATALVRAAARRVAELPDKPCGPNSWHRQRAVGLVLAITPWNNPLAIPLGKLAPALGHGNAVIWKPSPLAEPFAAELITLIDAAGFPPGLVTAVHGDERLVRCAIAREEIDAVTFTGSLLGGLAVQEACARRYLPLQAELGGNNAVIVWDDVDFPSIAAAVVEGAFGFAGQRCTAGRRLIVPRAQLPQMLAELERALAALPSGDPLDPDTRLGPLVSREKRDEVATRLAICDQVRFGPAGDDPRFHPAAIVVAEDPTDEIVTHELFGPVLAVQPASDFSAALRLAAGVRQGLAAALFTASRTRQAQFLAEMPVGILKLDQSTADADAEAPFGGWRASGIGPPEHGDSNREFYTRTQALYRDPHAN